MSDVLILAGSEVSHFLNIWWMSPNNEWDEKLLRKTCIRHLNPIIQLFVTINSPKILWFNCMSYIRQTYHYQIWPSFEIYRMIRRKEDIYIMRFFCEWSCGFSLSEYNSKVCVNINRINIKKVWTNNILLQNLWKANNIMAKIKQLQLQDLWLVLLSLYWCLIKVFCYETHNLV